MRRRWALKEKELWAQVETGIRWDENRVRAEMEVERKKLEEQEKKVREEEMKRRLAEEKKKAEEDKKREEEERLRKEKELEEEQRLRQEEIVKAKKAAEKAEEEERKALGLSTADEDWRFARTTLQVPSSPAHSDPATNLLPNSNSSPAPCRTSSPKNISNLPGPLFDDK